MTPERKQEILRHCGSEALAAKAMPAHEEKFADRLFAAIMAQGTLEDDFINKCLDIFGVAHENIDSWPFSDTGYDWHDHSFELYGVRPGVVLTPEQQQQFWDLGFDKGWLNYSDDGEMYYSRACPAGAYKADSPKGDYQHAREMRKLREQRDQLKRELSEAQHKLSTDGITGLRAAYDVLSSEWGEVKVQRDQLRAFAQEAVAVVQRMSDAWGYISVYDVPLTLKDDINAVLAKAEPLLTGQPNSEEVSNG